MKSKGNQGVKVLVAGSILQFLLGIIYVWSVFVVPVSKHLGAEAAPVKLTLSYMLCFFAIGILLGGKLQVKIGPSKVVLIGGLMMALGMVLSSFVTSVTMLYITYGVVSGFGVGMAYNAVISSAPRWFPEKKGLVTGISVFSFGFSTVVFAPLVQKMVASSLGVTGTFRILSGVFAVATLLLFSFIKMPEIKGSAAAAFGDQRQYTSSEMLKTSQFYFIVVAMMLGTAAYFVVSPSFKTLPVERAMSESMATFLVMFTGIANALGRLGVPLLSDKIGREKAAILLFACTAIGVGLLVFAKGALLFAAISIIAFFYGGTSALFPLVTGKYFGMQHQGANYGMVMLGFAASSLIFPNIMGRISDVGVRFTAMALIVALGVVIFIVLPRLKEKKAVKA